MSDGLPCSKCPILDLGTVYPERDARDPWRRMPPLFEAAVKVFGRGMFNHRGHNRLAAELRLGHYCKNVREVHGPCTATRANLCQRSLREVLLSSAGAKKPEGQALNGILRLSSDETHHERLKATRVAVPTPEMRMPPISWERFDDV